MRATISKSFRFEAAHQLPNHDGKCARLHGHSYRIEVMVEGEIQRADGSATEGMVMDFSKLTEAWRPLHEQLDHRCLNDVMEIPTTAENLAAWLLIVLRASLPEVSAVRVWETASASAEVRAASH